jgi:hypothetical protein
MRAQVVDGDTLVIHFSVNSLALGKAFEIKGLDNIGPLYPLVSFSNGETKASISRSLPPAIDAMEPTLEVTARSSVVGGWAVPSTSLLPPGSAAPLSDVVVTVEADRRGRGRWMIAAKVANHIACEISADPPHSATGSCMSTKMLAPPELQPLEESVAQFLSTVQSVSLEEGGMALLLKNANGKQVCAKPFSETHVPVQRDEVNWLN